MLKTPIAPALFMLLTVQFISAWPRPQRPTTSSRIAVDDGVKQDFQGLGDIQSRTSHLPANEVVYTRANGQPFAQPTSAQQIGPNGPLLLQDSHLIEHLAHFARERIPERVVHARGAGAHGTFVVTTDFARKYTMMDVFSEVGKKTPVTVRFSTVGGESGSADEARDPRGFAIKFRSSKGIWDLILNNTPVFFIRDPAKFPLFIHTQKRNPQTHLKDPNMMWDYLGSNQESLYQFMRLFSDLGTPDGFVNMNGWSGHTYKWIKADGSWVYVKIIAQSNQGIKTFTAEQAAEVSAKDPDYATNDLFQRIASGKPPSWTMFAQVLSPQDAEKFRYNIFDLTKEWPENLVPKQEIGKFELDQNPENYFAEVEQAAFSPSNTVDGWEPSADPVLQSRLFSYPDAQRYRLGTNFQQLPINCPMNPVANFQRDGQGATYGNQGSRPNYMSTFQSINLPPKPYEDSNHTIWTGGAIRAMTQISPIDFEQPRAFWTSLAPGEKENLVKNVAGSLIKVQAPGVQKAVLATFEAADPQLSKLIEDAMRNPRQS